MIVKICNDKTTLTNISNIGTITRMIDTIPLVQILINDYEGNLYSSYADDSESVQYKDLQFQPIYILDDTETNYLFVGRIIQIEFSLKQIMLYCEGESGKLKDKPYSKNYEYATGKVKTVSFSGDDDKLELETLEDGTFSWTDDQFHDGNDNGILLTDRTGEEDDTEDGFASSRTFNNIENTSYTESNTYENTHLNNSSPHINTFSEVSGVSGSYFSAYVEYFIEFDTPINMVNDIKEVKLNYVVNMTPANVSSDEAYLECAGWMVYFKDKISGNVKRTLDAETYLEDDGTNYTGINVRIYGNAIRGSTPASYIVLNIYYLKLEVIYTTSNFNPIQYKITDNGDEWIISDDAGFPSQGVNIGDGFSIGESTTRILAESVSFSGVRIDIDTNFDKYMARNIVGIYPINILNEICNIEKAHWFETYDSNGFAVIKVLREENYNSSGKTIGVANYRSSFILERPANKYKSVRVYGNPYYSIEESAYDEDTDNTSPLEFTIIDANINTQSDAKAVAEGKLDFLKNIRPSTRLELVGDYSDLIPGELITCNLSRPSVTLTEIPIRRVDFSQRVFDDDLKTTIYVGMGQSPPEETLARSIKKGVDLAWKGQTDMLSSPVSSGVPILSHGNLLNLSSDDHTQYHNNTRGDARYLQLAGGTMSGAIAMGTNKLTGLGAGSANGDSVRYEQVCRLSDNQTIAGVKTFSDIPIQSNPSAFSVGDSTTQDIGSNGYTKLTYNTENYDLNNEFSSSRFTAKQKGVYHFHASLLIDNAAWAVGNVGVMVIYKNGVASYHGFRDQIPAAVTKYMSLNVSADFELDVDDYIEMYVYHSRGAATYTHNNVLYKYFMGYLITRTG